jgi:hypothetical protein
MEAKLPPAPIFVKFYFPIYVCMHACKDIYMTSCKNYVLQATHYLSSVQINSILTLCYLVCINRYALCEALISDHFTPVLV